MEEIEAPPEAVEPVQPVDPKKLRKRSRRWLTCIVLLMLCGCGGVILLPGVLLPWILQARFPVKKVDCGKNMKAVAGGLLLYAADFDDRLPPSPQWVSAPIAHSKDPSFFNFFKCPAVTSSSYGYALNDWLGGTKISEVADRPKTVLLFEPRDSKMNAVGDPRKDAAEPPRHEGKNNFAFLDGHVEAMEKL